MAMGNSISFLPGGGTRIKLRPMTKPADSRSTEPGRAQGRQGPGPIDPWSHDAMMCDYTNIIEWITIRIRIIWLME